MSYVEISNLGVAPRLGRASGQVLLHLSDLHFKHNETGGEKLRRDKILNELIEVVSSVSTDWHPTIVCITGDVAYAGKIDDYVDARAWIERLLAALALSPDSLVVCAGNHDVHRESMKLTVPMNSRDADMALDYRSPSEPILHGWRAPFHNFEEFNRALGIPEYTFCECTTRLIGKRTVNGIDFVIWNSAWFCKGLAKQNGFEDHGLLFIGKPLLEAMDQCQQLPLIESDPSTITIVLMHHPAEFLHPDEVSGRMDGSTMSFLNKRYRLLLSGHFHGQDEIPLKFNTNFRLIGGATYQDAKHGNNFRLIRVCNGYFKVMPCNGDPLRYKDKYWHWRDTFDLIWPSLANIKSMNAAVDDGLMVTDQIASKISKDPAATTLQRALPIAQTDHSHRVANAGQRIGDQVQISSQTTVAKSDAILTTNEAQMRSLAQEQSFESAQASQAYVSDQVLGTCNSVMRFLSLRETRKALQEIESLRATDLSLEETRRINTVKAQVYIRLARETVADESAGWRKKAEAIIEGIRNV